MLALALVVVGGAAALLAARALLLRGRERRHGRLVAVDRPGEGAPLRSDRYRLVGRPDALRRLPDGRYVPVELKRRATPSRGPLPSHATQVEVYCLLVEETTSVAPPYGVLRYGDGGEFRIPWDLAARRRVLALRARVGGRYDGRATPSTAKCRHCAWRDSCDARAA